MIKNIFSGKDLYKELNFDDSLRKTREKKYNYTSPENIMVIRREKYFCGLELVYRCICVNFVCVFL